MKTPCRGLLTAALTTIAAALLVACAAGDDADRTPRGVAPIETMPGCGPLCGNGTLDPGEQCDPPGTATCDATCQLIPVNTCGDCVVQSGEECDPPDGTTCDATCHTIVPTGPSCGDGEINQASEECEPPGTPAGNFTRACGATCTFVGPTLCAACEAAKCDAFFGSPGAWGCDGLTGGARSNCEALVQCIRDTDCAVATHDAQGCYCGSANDLGCLTGGANGACKAQYEAAAGTADPSVIAGVFTDPASPIGLANNQITCDVDTSEAMTCTSVCPL